MTKAIITAQHICNSHDEPWQGWVAPGQYLNINMMGKERSKKQVYWLSQGRVFPTEFDALQAYPAHKPIRTREF